MPEIMDEGGFSFYEFSVEMEEFEVRKTGKFDRMWKMEPGGTTITVPCVHEGIVYIGSSNFNAYAIDARTGGLVWKFKTEGIILESSPACWKGKVFIGSFDYNMYALDAKTGELKWKFKTQGEIDVSPYVELMETFKKIQPIVEYHGLHF